MMVLKAFYGVLQVQIWCGPGLKQNITRTIMKIDWNSNIAVVMSVLL